MNKITQKKIIIFFILSALLLGIFYCIFELRYSQKIYPNIYTGEFQIGGLSKIEAKKLINQQVDNVNQKGINFVFREKEITIYPIRSSSDAEIVKTIIDFNVNKTIDNAFYMGKNGNILEKISFLFNRKNIALETIFEKEEIIDDLKRAFSSYSPQNAYFYLDNNLLKIKGEKDGYAINYTEGMDILESNLSNLNFSEITLSGIQALAEIREEDCLLIKNEVEDILNLTPIILKYDKKSWAINKDDMIEIIELSKNNDELLININEEKARIYIKENIASQIDQSPRLPKFNLSNGTVENFEPGREGRKLDIEKTVSILSKLIDEPFKYIDLPVEKIVLDSSYSNELEIREIIGRYNLSFGSSTANRIANIQNGANSLNGILLKPGEEFSTINALGEIDENNGYFKEAVIKNDAIVYEFGGGLCHLSTTLFRATLSAGLPITMRQNHSYHMPYYEPAGMDTTIYYPLPDFRFINDTGKHILIQAELRDGGLLIELWGTNDGRIINISEPVVYNIVKPNPTKIIKTNTLPSQKMECTLIPYDGLDAYFDYEIIYPSGEVRKKRFESHYIPRQGVCLLGN